MFAYIRGTLVHKEPTYLIVDVQGIGYRLNISLYTYTRIGCQIGDTLQLHVHFHVQENAHTLYGFVDEQEKQLFLMLMTVSGIGANTAVMMLSAMNPDEIVSAILHEDIRRLQSIKGIGEKTARRLLVELKDNLKKQWRAILPANDPGIAAYYPLQEEAVQALVVLGLARSQAEKNVRMILQKLKGQPIALEELIKQSLNA